ncbi:hypothetical protein K466DRAFT_558928 [Polyporus arcularius HHB13444]|uniref:Protein kinase domain-containing protein n=1 Tax=Polyporus arcularius HHB13444 TaxID=1314778 RepID=A0A5C3NVJ4_9APHY|nr:hypothetical protein K466DRAFT_558928 [Polyporus arcularius HHB13444]
MRVYQVEVSDDLGLSGRAVCKIASDVCIQSLRHEVNIYQTKLKTLQGTVVPKVYGIYTGRVDGERVHVLLEEYCGPPSDGVPGTLSRSIRMDILIAAFKLHAAGVMHNDIVYLSRSIPFGDLPTGASPDIRFVGFDKATIHECPMVEKATENDIKTDIQKFGDDCLLSKCRELRIIWSCLGFDIE